MLFRIVFNNSKYLGIFQLYYCMDFKFDSIVVWQQIFYVLFFFFFKEYILFKKLCVWGIQLRTLYMLGKHSIPELHTQASPFKHAEVCFILQNMVCLGDVPCELEVKVHSAIIIWGSPQTSIISSWLMVLLSSTGFLLNFCLLDLFISGLRWSIFLKDKQT